VAVGLAGVALGAGYYGYDGDYPYIDNYGYRDGYRYAPDGNRFYNDQGF
jgi:hypothetical protein